ncbi:MAG: hypothetical protein ACKO7G_09635, partial [Gammaproteobacteria bacterium]
LALNGGDDMGALPVAEVDDGLFDGHGLSHTPGPWEGQTVLEPTAGSKNEAGGGVSRFSGDFARCPMGRATGNCAACIRYRLTAQLTVATVNRHEREAKKIRPYLLEH